MYTLQQNHQNGFFPSFLTMSDHIIHYPVVLQGGILVGEAGRIGARELKVALAKKVHIFYMAFVYLRLGVMKLQKGNQKLSPHTQNECPLAPPLIYSWFLEQLILGFVYNKFNRSSGRKIHVYFLNYKHIFNYITKRILLVAQRILTHCSNWERVPSVPWQFLVHNTPSLLVSFCSCINCDPDLPHVHIPQD